MLRIINSAKVGDGGTQQALSPSGASTDANSEALKSEYLIQFPVYSLEDMELSDQTLSMILDFVSYQKSYQKVFKDWGLDSTHGKNKQISVNLYGAPGTGKTMACHAIAHALNKKILIVNYAEIESKYVGETSKNIGKLFERASEIGDVIIFFDEADALLSKRVSSMSSSTDVSVNQTRSVLLTLLNNYEGIVVFATNFVENYDSAFMRRILSHIRFDLPDASVRAKLWRRYIPEKMPCNVDFYILSLKSEGFSGSDISNAVLKSALTAARKNSDCITMDFFENSIDEIRLSKVANGSNIRQAVPSVKVETREVSESFVKSQLASM